MNSKECAGKFLHLSSINIAFPQKCRKQFFYNWSFNPHRRLSSSNQHSGCVLRRWALCSWGGCSWREELSKMPLRSTAGPSSKSYLNALIGPWFTWLCVPPPPDCADTVLRTLTFSQLWAYSTCNQGPLKKLLIVSAAHSPLTLPTLRLY